jgi:hypothetical protein
MSDRALDRDAEVRRLCREDAKRVVAGMPPLTPAQRDELGAILRSSRAHDVVHGGDQLERTAG